MSLCCPGHISSVHRPQGAPSDGPVSCGNRGPTLTERRLPWSLLLPQSLQGPLSTPSFSLSPFQPLRAVILVEVPPPPSLPLPQALLDVPPTAFLEGWRGMKGVCREV